MFARHVPSIPYQSIDVIKMNVTWSFSYIMCHFGYIRVTVKYIQYNIYSGLTVNTNVPIKKMAHTILLPNIHMFHQHMFWMYTSLEATADRRHLRKYIKNYISCPFGGLLSLFCVVLLLFAVFFSMVLWVVVGYLLGEKANNVWFIGRYVI